MRISSVLLMVAFLFKCNSVLLAQIISNKWFDKDYSSCIVLLEKKTDFGFIPHGTGFLIYNYSKDQRAQTVVTCEHNLRNKEIYVTIEADTSLLNYLKKNNLTSITLNQSLWELDENVLRTKVVLTQNVTYAKHSSLDIAAFQIDISSKAVFKSDTVTITKIKGIPKSQIRSKNDISIGEDVYFLGFPFLIGTKGGYHIPTKKGAMPSGKYKQDASNPLLRSGTIGWISSKENEFLLDALSYGGNSGSPVLTKGEIGLLGMVIGHLGEELEIEINPEEQKETTRLTGNSGLARCLWIDDILPVVEQARKLK